MQLNKQKEHEENTRKINELKEQQQEAEQEKAEKIKKLEQEPKSNTKKSQEKVNKPITETPKTEAKPSIKKPQADPDNDKPTTNNSKPTEPSQNPSAEPTLEVLAFYELGLEIFYDFIVISFLFLKANTIIIKIFLSIIIISLGSKFLGIMYNLSSDELTTERKINFINVIKKALDQNRNILSLANVKLAKISGDSLLDSTGDSIELKKSLRKYDEQCKSIKNLVEGVRENKLEQMRNVQNIKKAMVADNGNNNNTYY